MAKSRTTATAAMAMHIKAISVRVAGSSRSGSASGAGTSQACGQGQALWLLQPLQGVLWPWQTPKASQLRGRAVVGMALGRLLARIGDVALSHANNAAKIVGLALG